MIAKFMDGGAPVQANQFLVEFEGLLGILSELNLRRVLEIGVDKGGTLYQWIKLGPELVAGIDLPGGRWASGDYTGNVGDFERWGRQAGVKVEVLLGDSHARGSVDWARERAPFDFLFIDGDHSYEGVQRDWALYGWMVREGGVIAFHDVLKHARDEGIGVWRLWRMLSGLFPSKLLVSGEGQDEKGIGVLWMK